MSIRYIKFAESSLPWAHRTFGKRKAQGNWSSTSGEKTVRVPDSVCVIPLLLVVRPLKLILHTVMRKEAVYTVLLNAPRFKGMRFTLAQDPRYLRFSVLENGVTTHYNFRVRLGLPFSDHPLYGLLTSVCGCRCQTRGSQKNSLRRSTHIFQANEVI